MTSCIVASLTNLLAQSFHTRDASRLLERMAFDVSLRYHCLELIVDVVQCFTINAQSVDYSLVRVLESKTGKVCSDISLAYLLASSMRCPKKDNVLCSAADRF